MTDSNTKSARISAHQLRIETALSNADSFFACSIRTDGQIHRLFGVFADAADAAEEAARYAAMGVKTYVLSASALL